MDEHSRLLGCQGVAMPQDSSRTHHFVVRGGGTTRKLIIIASSEEGTDSTIISSSAPGGEGEPEEYTQYIVIYSLGQGGE